VIDVENFDNIQHVKEEAVNLGRYIKQYGYELTDIKTNIRKDYVGGGYGGLSLKISKI
jgi:hypothetical protein